MKFCIKTIGKLLNIVEEVLSSREIREERLRYFLSKVKVWVYTKITHNKYQKLSKEDQSSLLKSYYQDMCVMFAKAGKILSKIFEFCLNLSEVCPNVRNSSNSSSNMSKKFFANKYVPNYQSEDIPWYERDSLLTCIDALKCKEFLYNCDEHFLSIEVINFSIINHRCKSIPLQNSVEYYNIIRLFPRPISIIILKTIKKCYECRNEI